MGRNLKKINKVRIIERLRSKLDLTDLESEVFALSERVLLVTNIDDLLRRPFYKTISKDLSGGGSVDVFTVPKGKRWTLKGIVKGATVGSVWVILVDSDGLPAVQSFSLIAAGTVEVIQHGLNYSMDEEDVLRVGGGNVADSAISFKVAVEEEDVF